MKAFSTGLHYSAVQEEGVVFPEHNSLFFLLESAGEGPVAQLILK